ncbi:hypothetical protein [Comamonas sp.]|uniref:hypothetical protein n=1 Tax=Comamonas sp. TaxID=34028 RepID=UPI00289FFC23|nr:hypothetical protein [Comamonas sp.]
MNWMHELVAVMDAYRNAPNPNQPVSRDDYLKMLAAFRRLLPLAEISDSQDTAIRRNLPGGGLSGFQLVSLLQRISDAETYVSKKPVFPMTAESIAMNIYIALESMDVSDTSEEIMNSLRGTFQKILDGNLQ